MIDKIVVKKHHSVSVVYMLIYIIGL